VSVVSVLVVLYGVLLLVVLLLVVVLHRVSGAVARWKWEVE
jgi:hypothetical protein